MSIWRRRHKTSSSWTHSNTRQPPLPPSPNTQTHSSISVSIWNLFCFDLAIELCYDCKFVMLRLSPTEVWELSPPLSLFDSSKYFNCPQDKDQIRNPTHTSHAQIFCISHQQRFARSDFFLPNATRCLAKLPAPCTMEASAWGTEQIISFHLILRQLVCLFEFLYGSWKCRKPLSNNTCQTSSWQTNNFEDVLLSFVLPRANISFTAPSKQQDDKQSWTRLHFLVAKCQLKHMTACLHGNKRLRDLTWIFPRSMFSDSDTQLLNAAKIKMRPTTLSTHGPLC